MFKPAGIFLLSLFLFSQVYNTAVWVNYELNIKEITEAFCENTDKPELHCNGKCHLKKQLIQTDQSNSTESPLAIYLNDIQLFPNSNESELPTPVDDSISHQTLLCECYSYLSSVSVFHPPQV
tara:strand:+ start:26255 stop:26623 length:369 start_codon:yes stop_codon:yes gene_type:complete